MFTLWGSQGQINVRIRVKIRGLRSGLGLYILQGIYRSLGFTGSN